MPADFASAAPTEDAPPATRVPGTPAPAGPAFEIRGDVVGLTPGRWSTIQLTVTNPTGADLEVTSITVTPAPDSTPPGCLSAVNLRIVQSAVSSAAPLHVSAGDVVTLDAPPLAPQLMLLDLPDVNQDACKGATLSLSYSGSATW
jgi:hypothetical protein